MKSITGIQNKLQYHTSDVPIVKDDQTLIKVHYAGLNRADLLQIEGSYPSPDGSNILGLEVSGIDQQTGKEVCALLTSGGFAEYVAVNKNHIMPVPNGLTLKEAAILPEALITSWLNLVYLGNLSQNKKVLIHGGSSGLGTIAIQLANALQAHAFTTVGNNNKVQRCLSLGAQAAFNYHGDFVSPIKEQGGVDLVLDILGGQYLASNLKCLNKYGKLILIAAMSGSQIEVNLGQVLMKNLTITGSTLRNKTDEEKTYLIQQVMQQAFPLIEAGKIKPLIDSEFTFDNANQAIERMKSREHFGKIIISM